MIVGIVIGLVLAAVRFVLPPIAEEIAIAKLSQPGLPLDVHLKLRYCWTSTGPGVRGEVNLNVLNSPWALTGDFMAAPCQWHATARIEETLFRESDPVLQQLIARIPINTLSNMTCSGAIDFEASVDRTFSLPVTRWTARANLRNVDFSAVARDNPVSLSGGSASFGASGMADHVDIAPIFPRIESLTYGNYTMTNLRASIRATEQALMINEASADFWGGRVYLYSVFLNPKNLNAGLTLFYEDVDVDQVLHTVKCFSGSATGRLHGKAKLFLLEGGKGIRLRDAFLYTSPGEIGKIRMTDTDALAEGLAFAGLDESNRKSVSNALTDMDYNVLRLNLRRQSDDDAVLSVRLEGSATRKNVTVPVVLNITLHGAIEQLINTGLKLNNRKNAKP